MVHAADAHLSALQPIPPLSHPRRQSPIAAIVAALESERDRWFAWLPVMLGLGIAGYILLPREPSLLQAIAPVAAAVVLAIVWRGNTGGRIATSLLLAVTAGFAVAKVRSDIVAAPVLHHPLTRATLTGFVELVEPRPDRGQRLTIRVHALGDLPANRVPARVRVRTPVAGGQIAPGDFVSMVANVSPPAMPALPGGYDFARAAWFQGLGGVGFAAGGATVEAPPVAPPVDLRLRAVVERLRQDIGQRVTAALPGETGEIANALITGQRGGITEATNDAFRDSGLLHILSISGLHMVIMAGAVFFSIRLLLAAIPAIALRYPIKKWSAAGACLGALGYLMISGAEFATVRSWIMISIMFLAVLVDRPAVAMRNVALAALALLVIYPEGLFNVGFQMSFAAVVSLVSAYEMIRAREQAGTGLDHGPFRRLAVFFFGIVLTTLIASLSVAPFAAYHFHKSQQYAILANLIAIPVCNIIVMPAALATLLALPFGLEAAPLYVMGKGIEAMVWCASTVAALPGAVGRIAAIPTAAFMLMVTGGLWLVLWRQRWRLLGLLPILAGLAISGYEPRPDILVGREGAAIALRQPDGRFGIQALRSGQFEVTRWLEHDGDSRPAGGTVAPEIFKCDAEGCLGRVKSRWIAIPANVSGLHDDCRRADIIVLKHATTSPCGPPGWPRRVAPPITTPQPQVRRPLLITARDLRHRGTHALYIGADSIRVETVADSRGHRPWSASVDDPDRVTPTRRSGGGRPAPGPQRTATLTPSGPALPADPSAPQRAPDLEDEDHR